MGGLTTPIRTAHCGPCTSGGIETSQISNSSFHIDIVTVCSLILMISVNRAADI